MVELPPISSLVRPDEYALSRAQIDRFRSMEEASNTTGRDKRSRWLIAAAGTPGPRPEVYDDRFVRPWAPAWTALNDPMADPMVGVCVMDETTPARGLIILTRPTTLAYDLWELARITGQVSSLAAETSVLCAAPEPDYRAVFPRCTALPAINGEAIRWAFDAAPQVITAKWLPPRERARREREAALADERGIAADPDA